MPCALKACADGEIRPVTIPQEDQGRRRLPWSSTCSPDGDPCTSVHGDQVADLRWRTSSPGCPRSGPVRWRRLALRVAPNSFGVRRGRQAERMAYRGRAGDPAAVMMGRDPLAAAGPLPRLAALVVGLDGYPRSGPSPRSKPGCPGPGRARCQLPDRATGSCAPRRTRLGNGPRRHRRGMPQGA